MRSNNEGKNQDWHPEFEFGLSDATDWESGGAGRNMHEEEDKQYGLGHIGFEVPVSLLGEPSQIIIWTWKGIWAGGIDLGLQRLSG